MEEFEQGSPATDAQLNATLAPLAQCAVALHEIYLANVAAGFTEAQALQIAIAIVTSGMTKQ